jgi:hypothetical protein
MSQSTSASCLGTHCPCKAQKIYLSAVNLQTVKIYDAVHMHHAFLVLSMDGGTQLTSRPGRFSCGDGSLEPIEQEVGWTTQAISMP